MEYILSNMETDRLRHFKTIVETGGLMKASEILGITGGGLSKSIKVLENELGLELFQQKGRGLELTEIGQEFYSRLPSVLIAFENLIDFEDSKKPLDKAIRLSSFEVFTTYFLSSFIAENLDKNVVEVREAIPGKMEQLISDGNSDIGITYEPIPYKGVEFLKVSKIKMAVYAKSRSKFLSMPLEEMPFVIPIAPLQGTPSGVRGLDGWPEHLFERNIQYRVEMMETALQLCHKGAAVSFLPQFVAEAFNQQGVSLANKLVEVKLPKKILTIYRDVFIIIRKGTSETPLIKKLAKSIRKLST